MTDEQLKDEKIRIMHEALEAIMAGLGKVGVHPNGSPIYCDSCAEKVATALTAWEAVRDLEEMPATPAGVRP